MTNACQPPDHVLDATGLRCPEPLLAVRKQLARLAPGQLLEVRVDDPLAELDLAVFCDKTGHQLVSGIQGQTELVVVIRKRRDSASG